MIDFIVSIEIESFLRLYINKIYRIKPGEHDQIL